MIKDDKVKDRINVYINEFKDSETIAIGTGSFEPDNSLNSFLDARSNLENPFISRWIVTEQEYREIKLKNQFQGLINDFKYYNVVYLKKKFKFDFDLVFEAVSEFGERTVSEFNVLLPIVHLILRKKISREDALNLNGKDFELLGSFSGVQFNKTDIKTFLQWIADNKKKNKKFENQGFVKKLYRLIDYMELDEILSLSGRPNILAYLADFPGLINPLKEHLKNLTLNQIKALETLFYLIPKPLATIEDAIHLSSQLMLEDIRRIRIFMEPIKSGQLSINQVKEMKPAIVNRVTSFQFLLNRKLIGLEELLNNYDEEKISKLSTFWPFIKRRMSVEEAQDGLLNDEIKRIIANVDGHIIYENKLALSDVMRIGQLSENARQMAVRLIPLLGIIPEDEFYSIVERYEDEYQRFNPDIIGLGRFDLRGIDNLLELNQRESSFTANLARKTSSRYIEYFFRLLIVKLPRVLVHIILDYFNVTFSELKAAEVAAEVKIENTSWFDISRGLLIGDVIKIKKEKKPHQIEASSPEVKKLHLTTGIFFSTSKLPKKFQALGNCAVYKAPDQRIKI